VANYRGIDTREVNFGPLGITLVQGPNEAGKTSLGEAIGILFEYFDSSKHRNVDAIRPVHRDEGPEIELQAESGPYAFTYFKRFHKKPETRLTVTRPKPENHTGREAHERAEAILRETLDVNLWKALNIQQGEAIQQPDLGKQTFLSAALDQAAGGRSADPQQEGLFDKVKAEYGLYFTPGGAEKKEIQEARKLQTVIQTEIVTIEDQIRALEKDIERSAALQQELEQLKKQDKEQEGAVASYTTLLEEIVSLENVLAAARLKLESAQQSEQSARRDKEERQGLINAVANAVSAHGDLQESGKISLSALNPAEEELKRALSAFDAVDGRKREADDLAALRRADYDYYNNKLHLEQLQERKDRIDRARRIAVEAEKLLARNKVDALALKAIQDAERALLTAEAQLQTGAPNVLLRGLAECRLKIDDATVVLAKDEVRTLSVADKTRLVIPEALAIEITGGAGAEGLSGKVAAARRALERACKAAEVRNGDEARVAFDQRRGAERDLKAKETIEEENLRDLTYEELERKLIGLQQSVPEYLGKRGQQPVLCPDLESAKKEWANAELSRKKLAEQWETARKAVDAARTVRDELNSKHQEVRVQLDMLAKDLNHARQNLDWARETVPDDRLDANLADAALAVSGAESSAVSAEASLKARNPERVKESVETARGSLRTTQTRLTAARTELTEVQTRLKIHGEEGLHEKLNAAQSRFEHLEKDNRALFRRAAAARLLFETMRDERDKARRAYVAPLKEKIEHLGRLVFDVSFQVDVNEDLQIAGRTTNGITVPFSSLSGGTREQLSLLFRLACSMIVAKDGGTPLILDDALGYTDPERLRSMGVALARAARECQIIIFTCVPERYSNVGEATLVCML
jgi:DNA repair exonuclease SbcCD ATPase subunit